MARRFSVLAALLVGLSTSLVAGTSTTTAAVPAYNYIGYAGGTQIQALGTTINSDLTSQSSISGTKIPNSATNNVAAVNVGTLLTVGAVETSETASRIDNGIKLVSKARTAGINLLNGLIRADAVTTTAVGKKTATSMSAVASTEFLNLRINGRSIPANVPENTNIGIPGVATVTLNHTMTTEKAGGAYNVGNGLVVTLLQARGGAPIGSRIILNPTYSAVLPEIPYQAAQVGGLAYGSHVIADSGPGLSAQAGRSAMVGTPPSGTNNELLRNTTAGVNILGVISAGAIESTSRSITISGFSEVTNTSQVARVNLLSGLVRADAIKATAHSVLRNGTFSADQKLEFINLVVGGSQIPVNVGPNTTIKVGDVASVTINKQVKGPNSNLVCGVCITLLQPRAGLPVGAKIELVTAATWIIH